MSVAVSDSSSLYSNGIDNGTGGDKKGMEIVVMELQNDANIASGWLCFIHG